MHSELAQPVLEEREIALPNFFVRQWAAPQCQHVMVPPGEICFHEMLDVFRAMPLLSLCYCVLLRDFWLDVNTGQQQISL